MEILLYIFQLAIIIFAMLCALDIIKIDKDYNKTFTACETCPHDNTEIRVLKSVVTCETTAVFCTECNVRISEPKIECR